MVAEMNILFLDIDGVLTSMKSQAGPKVEILWSLEEERLVDDFDPDCIDRLKRILKETGASVVISSSWRERFTLETLIKHFEGFGVTGIIGMTPVLKDHRGKEIQAWLDEHKDVDRFVILDDYNDMVHLSPYLIRIHWKTGIAEHNVIPAIEMLR